MGGDLTMITLYRHFLKTYRQAYKEKLSKHSHSSVVLCAQSLRNDFVAGRTQYALDKMQDLAFGYIQRRRDNDKPAN